MVWLSLHKRNYLKRFVFKNPTSPLRTEGQLLDPNLDQTQRNRTQKVEIVGRIDRNQPRREAMSYNGIKQSHFTL